MISSSAVRASQAASSAIVLLLVCVAVQRPVSQLASNQAANIQYRLQKFSYIHQNILVAEQEVSPEHLSETWLGSVLSTHLITL